MLFRSPVLDRNNVVINFFNFLTFLTIFYFEFSSSGWVGTEFGSKIFFPSFSACLIPFWLKIMVEIDFLIFRFFFYFFRNFLTRVEYKRKSGLNFFLSFSAYLIPFWLKITPERGFLIFKIFLLLFLEFSCLRLV